MDSDLEQARRVAHIENVSDLNKLRAAQAELQKRDVEQNLRIDALEAHIDRLSAHTGYPCLRKHTNDDSRHLPGGESPHVH